MQLICLWPDDPLYRETRVITAVIGGNLYCFEIRKEAAAMIPAHIGRSVYNIISLKRTYWNIGNVIKSDFRGQFFIIRYNFVEYLFLIVHHIHFIDAYHHLWKAQQRYQKRVAYSLLDH